MTIGDIYDFFIREGIKTDVRSSQQIKKELSGSRKEYRELKSSLKKFFDKDNFYNPYADTRILHGRKNKQVKRILVGIDIGVGELLLADHLAKGGEEIDLVIAHHPSGMALAGLHEVMALQKDLLHNLGVDGDVAKDLMNKRMGEVSRGVHGANHTRVADAAKLLNIPLMCCHTPADNHVSKYLQKMMNTQKPKTLARIIDLLLKEPEYKDAALNKAGPRVLLGKKENKSGKIFVDMTGGTEGSRDIFPRLSQLGIQTLLGMHLSEAHYNKVSSEHMNVVIAGHMASDNLGMNLLFDKLERKSKLEILECSGYRRIKR